MLSELAHPNCTQMLAFCAKPMTLLLELAPTGSLDKILTEFRRCGQRLHMESLQRASLQIAKALEYLHVNQHIIYRVRNWEENING
jgi:serine/threonine protein kinase